MTTISKPVRQFAAVSLLAVVLLAVYATLVGPAWEAYTHSREQIADGRVLLGRLAAAAERGSRAAEWERAADAVPLTRLVLKGETEVMLREAPASTRNRASRDRSRRGNLAPRTETRPADAGLQAALRAWRSEIARQRSVPAYVVLHDSTIDGIAAARPASLDELRNIPGIGDKKLEHYGDELIALVQAADA